MLALLTILVATLGATLTTYTFEKAFPLTTRLAVGAVLGHTFSALVGFAAAMVWGVGLFSVGVTATAAVSPMLLLLRRGIREGFIDDCNAAGRRVHLALTGREPGAAAGFVLFVVLLAVLFPVFTRAIYGAADGIYTGVFVNRFDLPLHVSIIQGFVTGGNLPPQHPEFAGARLTYPFLVDFGAAQLVLAGLDLYRAVAVQNIVLITAVVVLLHRWALTLTGDRVAAVIAPFLVLLGSGMGWVVFASDTAQTHQSLAQFLWNLPYDYTINTRNLKWGNLTTTILVSQRSFLLGLPLFLIASMLWWRALSTTHADQGSSPPEVRSPASRRLMCAAGVTAGLLPLAHPHSFLVLIGAAACLTLLFRQWRHWAAFFVVAVAVAAPQLWWISRDSGIDSQSFVGWHYGWTKETESLPWFWFKNTGLFIPLIVAAVAARGRWRILPQRLLLFYLPFIGCFIVPQLVRLAPRPSANIKVLIYWYIASTLLVAMALARVWRAGAAAKAIVVALIATLTLSAGLDVWRVTSGASAARVFDSDGVALAALVERATPPDAVLLHAPIRQAPTSLSGRPSVLADLLHVGSHGFAYAARKEDVDRIYAGDPDSLALMRRYRVDYVVVGPAERLTLGARDSMFKNHELVGTAGGYNLYRVVYSNGSHAHRLHAPFAEGSRGDPWSAKPR